MNVLLKAWETTIEDIEYVVDELKEDIAVAPDLYAKLDHEAIAKAALHGNNMAQQTYYAYEEIKRQITEGKLI